MTKMLHIVLLKFDAAKLAAEFPPSQSVQHGIDHLKRIVPGLLELYMNEKNTQPWEGYVDCSGGYTHALISKHVDANALRVYAEHPDHKAIQARFGKCMLEPAVRIEMNTESKI